MDQTTSNHNATANHHNSVTNTALAKLFPASRSFTSRSLVTASNSGDSSASRAQVLSSQPPVQNPTELVTPTVLIVTSRHGPHRKHCSSFVSFVSVVAGTCLLGCCAETAAAWTTENTVLLLFRACTLPALPSYGRCS
jgi:hypothetical protein